jgi:hypothetical protein
MNMYDKIFAEFVKFRVDWAENSGREMIRTLIRVASRSLWIVRIALAVSIPHQITYLISQSSSHLHFNSFGLILDSIGMVLMAVAVPVVSDLWILNCIDTVAGKLVATSSKVRALCIMVIPASISGYVNFVAPGPDILKWLSAYLVLSIPLNELLRIIKVNFKAFGDIEAEVASIDSLPSAIPPVEEPKIIRSSQISPEELAARKRDLYEAMTRGEKIIWTRNFRNGKAIRDLKREIKSTKSDLEEIPVSPAPMVG